MWDLIVSVPDYCLSFYFVSLFSSLILLRQHYAIQSVEEMLRIIRINLCL